MPDKKRVLFLCTHNSCRSQMAEGLINDSLGDRFEAFSAGTIATRVNPLATRVMEELGIEMNHHYSKTLAEFDGESFDVVITLCSDAAEHCPQHVGGSKTIHIGFDDPSRLPGSETEVFPEYRRVRDQLRHRLTSFLTGECCD